MTAERDTQQDQIRRRLQALRPVPPRDPEVAAERRSAFLRASRYAALRRQAAQATRPRARLATVLIGLALAVVSSLGLTVSAAQAALPGDPLYPVKLGAEQLGITLTFSPAARGQRLVDRVITRAQELDVLAFSAPERVGPTDLTRFNRHAAAARDEVQALSHSDAALAQTLLKRLEEATTLQQSAMRRIEREGARGSQIRNPEAPGDAQPEMQDQPSGARPEDTTPSPQCRRTSDVATATLLATETAEPPERETPTTLATGGRPCTTATPHRTAQPTPGEDSSSRTSVTPSTSGTRNSQSSPGFGGSSVGPGPGSS